MAEDGVRDETDDVSGYVAVETSEGAEIEPPPERSREGTMEERVHPVSGEETVAGGLETDRDERRCSKLPP
jgi:hypothetical protein